MATSAAESDANGDRPPTRFIGLFGGTFDPVHHGHLRVALDALELLGLDEVRLVPLAHAVHRDQPATTAKHRMAMLEAAVADHPRLIADARELQRDGPSYTVDTLRSLRTEFPRKTLCLLMGADAFNGFDSWREPASILELANIAILPRPGVALADNVREIVDQRRVDRLRPGQTGQVIECPVAQLAIASSDIRRRLRTGRGIDFLLPDAVLRLIESQGLYR